jgi:hypothetical protein
MKKSNGEFEEIECFWNLGNKLTTKTKKEEMIITQPKVTNPLYWMFLLKEVNKFQDPLIRNSQLELRLISQEF